MNLIPTPPIFPKNISVLFTSRQGGVSDSPFHSLNLSVHVQDDLDAVMENRMRLLDILPHAPRFPRQAHGARMICADDILSDIDVADAVYTTTPNVICAIQTADCLPILLWDENASIVAAIHAGWRGLASNIIEKSAEYLSKKATSSLFAIIGPRISANYYIVGEDVLTALCRPQTEHAFYPSTEKGKWHADLTALAMHRLHALGIQTVAIENACTYASKDLLFSARRNKQTGRQAAFIYLHQ